MRPDDGDDCAAADAMWSLYAASPAVRDIVASHLHMCDGTGAAQRMRACAGNIDAAASRFATIRRTLAQNRAGLPSVAQTHEQPPAAALPQQPQQQQQQSPPPRGAQPWRALINREVRQKIFEACCGRVLAATPLNGVIRQSRAVQAARKDNRIAQQQYTALVASLRAHENKIRDTVNREMSFHWSTCGSAEEFRAEVEHIPHRISACYDARFYRAYQPVPAQPAAAPAVVAATAQVR